MNNVDYDKNKFDTDGHGNLLAKDMPETKAVKYKNFTIDVAIGHVKLWDASDNFCGDFPDVATAKADVDCLLLLTK